MADDQYRCLTYLHHGIRPSDLRFLAKFSTHLYCSYTWPVPDEKIVMWFNQQAPIRQSDLLVAMSLARLARGCAKSGLVLRLSLQQRDTGKLSVRAATDPCEA